MKIVYIGVYQTLNSSTEGYRCAAEYDLSDVVNRFMQGSAAELLGVFVANASKSSKVQENADAIVTVNGDEQEDANMSKYNFYFRKRREGIVACVVTDRVYPKRVAQALATRVAGEFCDKFPRSAFENMPRPAKGVQPFNFPELKTYIKQYQNPEDADTITKIENELNQTRQTLVQNINLLVERGEKMDSLVAKSEDVSASSKLFYTQAKKQNSCCTVM